MILSITKLQLVTGSEIFCLWEFNFFFFFYSIHTLVTQPTFSSHMLYFSQNWNFTSWQTDPCENVCRKSSISVAFTFPVIDRPKCRKSKNPQHLCFAQQTIRPSQIFQWKKVTWNLSVSLFLSPNLNLARVAIWIWIWIWPFALVKTSIDHHCSAAALSLAADHEG